MAACEGKSIFYPRQCELCARFMDDCDGSSWMMEQEAEEFAEVQDDRD